MDHEEKIGKWGAAGRRGDKRQTMVDAVGVLNDTGILFLPEDFIEPCHGHEFGVDDIAQDVSGADGRELIDIADDYERRRRRNGGEQAGGEFDIEHRALVDDERIGVDGVFRVIRKPVFVGEVFQQAMDGLSLQARRFGQAMGGSSGWSEQADGATLSAPNQAKGPNDGGFTDAGSCG